MQPKQQTRSFPPSLAIAGGWGYIGQKFMNAALRNGTHVWVFDPGPIPDGVNLEHIEHIQNENTFLNLPASVYHLALHPYHRRSLFRALLARSETLTGLPLLVEKPMASWERPWKCNEVVQVIQESKAVVLYDFLELFDPMTDRIVSYLKRFQHVEIAEVMLARSKDREDPAIPRNYKHMQPIQYQESCHCLAFLLYVLGNTSGGYDAPLSQPITVRAESLPYDSPCPELFPVPVDGRCEAEMTINGTAVHLLTNFKRGACWQKRKTIKGIGDGAPFTIEAEYLEGSKWLLINGEDQGFAPDADSYDNALSGLWQMVNAVLREELQQGLYPNAAFSRWVFMLSAILHQSCTSHKTVEIDSLFQYQLSGPHHFT